MVTVGALPNVGARLMPGVVSRFKRSALETVVRVTTGSNAQMLNELRDGDLDLVIARLVDPADMVGLSFEHLYSEPLTLVVRAGHPLALARCPFDLAALSRHPISLPNAGTVIRGDIDRFFLAHGLRPSPDRVETISITFGRAPCPVERCDLGGAARGGHGGYRGGIAGRTADRPQPASGHDRPDHALRHGSDTARRSRDCCDPRDVC
ncbi:LysR substrate-binding domain-containing protein [Breoghania sp.]|uniref:LysR substrate-binding domain-containing protein n=1 Tax=Breoghania sp. TaxID=2065378 RepID=UPI00261E8492|nr:LysR substrate-binding domain-containing protein [Breoghania sp.]MDJ0933156.1 LysR substrate-binding domain-containing protein [Breoghania sp.]